MYVHLSAEKFDQLMKFVKFPRPTGAEIRLTGVSGFYSEWSPSIRTDDIKILANAKDQGLENPHSLTFEPPVLGYVKEFDFTQYGRGKRATAADFRADKCCPGSVLRQSRELLMAARCGFPCGQSVRTGDRSVISAGTETPL